MGTSAVLKVGFDSSCTSRGFLEKAWGTKRVADFDPLMSCMKRAGTRSSLEFSLF